MTLSTLIKKGGLINTMTVTVATTATQEADHLLTVAPVATVTVAPKSALSLNSNFLHPLANLTIDEEIKIRNWLAFIDETDADMISELINKCRTCHDARQYFLKRTKEIENDKRYFDSSYK